MITHKREEGTCEWIEKEEKAYMQFNDQDSFVHKNFASSLRTQYTRL